MSHTTITTLEKIVSLCKRKGFVFPAAEIYGGLNGVYDFGPLGFLLKENIKKAWTNSLFNERGEILFLDGSLLGPHALWNASGHTQHFHDPMVDCLNCKHRYRADHIDLGKACAHCGKKMWTEPREFNMMFQTQLGAATDNAAQAYLRPETAQTIFVNFKNVFSTSRVKVPFGIAQIGKAFRNEITPKQFLFRMREFEQMELEWFCKPENAADFFDFWQEKRLAFYQTLGIEKQKLNIHPHEGAELAHYSTQTNDIEYAFPFGWKELEGIANRGDFDLSQHSTHSGKELAVYDDYDKKSYIPHVIECSVGVDRLFLTLLFDAYAEDTIEGEVRTLLRFKPIIAPIKAAFLPLTKKQTDAMQKIYHQVQKETGFALQFDEAGSIGKRYRRQDEIGTPFCFTFDFDSEQDNQVTIRHRDTTQQERISVENISSYLIDHVK